MAITAKLTPATASVKFGESQKFTASATGAAEGSTLSYAWKVDSKAIADTTAEITVQADKVGSKAISVTVTETPTEGGATTSDASATLTVTNAVITGVTATATAAPATVEFGESSKVTVKVTGAPAGSTISYKWDAGETTDSITVTDPVGKKPHKCDVTVKKANYDDFKTSASADVTVTKADMTGIIAVVVGPDSAISNSKFDLSCDVSGVPSDAKVSYDWSTGDKTQKISAKLDGADITFTCNVTVTKDNYNDFKMSAEKVVELKDTSGDESEYNIHPLPEIDGAFMYAGYWALDEIQSLTEQGKDWKEETEFKFQKEIDALKAILSDFNLVMVQESRNGRILDREKLESGIIYDFYFQSTSTV